MSRMCCPWCGRTMIPGELESSQAIAWYPSEPESPANLRQIFSWQGIKALCAPITGNILVPVRGSWKKAANRLPVYHCPDCEQFVLIGRVDQKD